MKTIPITIGIVVGIIVLVASIAFFVPTMEANHQRDCHYDGGKVTGFLQCTRSHLDYSAEPTTVFITLGALDPQNKNPIHPKEMTVMLGENNTVTWLNVDGPSHIINFENWSIGPLHQGERKSITFNQTGVYQYFSVDSPSILGSVIVKPELNSMDRHRDNNGDIQDSSSDLECTLFEELKQKRDVMHGPMVSTPREFKILETHGFVICQKEFNTYYVLNAGEQGSITYQIFRGFDLNDPPIEDAQKLLIQNPLFYHETQTKDLLRKGPFIPTGVNVEYSSTSQTLGFNDTAVLTARVSVESDAPSKTMWLDLGPFEGNSGASIRFAVIGEENEN